MNDKFEIPMNLPYAYSIHCYPTSKTPRDETIIFISNNKLGNFPFTTLFNKFCKQGYHVFFYDIREQKAFNYHLLKIERHISTSVCHVIVDYDADDFAVLFLEKTTKNIDRVIFVNPTHRIMGSRIKKETLIIWSDKSHAVKNIRFLYPFFKEYQNIHFQGYPNIGNHLYAGIHYSQYIDRLCKNIIKGKTKHFFEKKDFYHVDDDIFQDIIDFLNGAPIKKKIAIMNENYLPFLNGVNVLCSNLKEELEKAGYKPYIVTYRLKGWYYFHRTQEKNVITLSCVPLPGKNTKKEGLYSSVRRHDHIKSLLPYDFSYLHLNCEYTISKIGMALHNKYHIPLLYTAHTFWEDMFFKRLPKILAYPFVFVLRLLFIDSVAKNCNIMTVPTNKAKDFWNKKGYTKNVVVLPGCIDPKRFALTDGDEDIIKNIRNSYDLEGKIVLGYVGRISIEKGIQEVIKYVDNSYKSLPNLIFLIIGNGPYSEELENVVSQMNHPERVIIVGEIPNDHLRLYYRLFDAFCTASTFETQGLTYLEAMESDTLVIAKDDECLKHFLKPDINGLVFKDEASWLEKIKFMINNKEEILKIKKSAKKTSHMYRKDVWARKVVDLYKQCSEIENKEKELVDLEEFNNVL